MTTATVNWDEVIEHELTSAGVPVEHSDMVEPRAEVVTSVSGLLGRHRFVRETSHSWLVVGDVPINVALELFDSPFRWNIRASGLTLQPDPRRPFVDYYRVDASGDALAFFVSMLKKYRMHQEDQW